MDPETNGAGTTRQTCSNLQLLLAPFHDVRAGGSESYDTDRQGTPVSGLKIDYLAAVKAWSR